jgi:hypothetical protein
VPFDQTANLRFKSSNVTEFYKTPSLKVTIHIFVTNSVFSKDPFSRLLNALRSPQFTFALTFHTLEFRKAIASQTQYRSDMYYVTYYIVGISSYTKTAKLKEIADNFLQSICNTCLYPREFRLMDHKISDIDMPHSFTKQLM